MKHNLPIAHMVPSSDGILWHPGLLVVAPYEGFAVAETRRSPKSYKTPEIAMAKAAVWARKVEAMLSRGWVE